MAKTLYLPAENSRVGIILCHAYTGSPLDVKRLAERLHRLGYGVLCPLFAGHGTLDIKDILAVSPEMWWQDVQEAIAFMKQEYEQLMVFGLSMGGIMAMKALTLGDPAIVGGGTMNSPVVHPSPLNITRRFVWYGTFLAKKREALDEFEQERDVIVAQHQAQVRELEAFTAAYLPSLSDVTVQVYVAQSGQDELIVADHVYDFLDLLENCKVDFHWFPENTHVITIDREREAFERSIEEYVQQQVNSE